MKIPIIEKARKRAIRALGGYTREELYPLQFGKYKEYTKMPVRIISCYMDHLRKDDPEYTDYIFERLISELAKGILRDKLYTLAKEDTFYGTEYRMTVEIIPPDDPCQKSLLA